MFLRILTGLFGIAIIVLAFMIKKDDGEKYSKSLREKYTGASVDLYLENAFYAELFFGSGMIVEAIFGDGFGYWIGFFICLLGIILLFVFMKKLVKRNIPYRKRR